MLQIQSIIHKLEVGGGLRHVKWALLGLALLLLMLGYNFREFKDMSTQEAMDSAQLARNLAEHRGYTTLFIRPFSMYLLQKAYADDHGPAPVGDLTDRSQIRTAHPDLANPPVYPLLLAGMMKLSPGFRYEPAGTAKFNLGRKQINLWNSNGSFWIYPPDFWISLLNQGFFLGMVVMVFFLARRLFDNVVAWTSAFLFIGTDLFWRFSMSGLSTMLVMFIFVSVAWCLLLLEQNAREAKWSGNRLLLFAAGIGALVGIGCLTRYSFGWLIIPTVLFLALFLGQHRTQICAVTLAVFALVIAPWVMRNYHVSHTFFGVSGYAAYADTTYFPEYRLERSLTPELDHVTYLQIWGKFVANTQSIIQDELPKLGGSWISAFFLVGLLINFKDPTRSRLRYFLLFCLPVLAVAQAVGRTQLSVESPVYNSENLLILIAPLVIIFGVSLFYILIDQMNFPFIQLRYFVIGVFCSVLCLPAIFSFLSPRTVAVAFPPYYPPLLQKTAAWMKPDELMMSDVPWAVAWYGERQCVWLTLDDQAEFFSIYDYQKPIKALYLTPITMDSRFVSEWIRPGEHGWAAFAHEMLLKKELPLHFPLSRAPIGFLPDQFFLTDSERWNQTTTTNTTPPP